MSNSATDSLVAITQGDRSSAEQLVETVYNDLRRLAHHYMDQERAGHTLQSTALVHEAYLKLIDQTKVDWRNRSHFFAIAAQAMRRILVNHAKGKGRIKRGGDRRKISLDEALTVSKESSDDVLALDEALERLAEIDEQQAKIVELRFFGGMTVDETAVALDLPKRTVEREWTACRAWLRRELSEHDDL
jgi:RNA polymerase sigma factor (TIGR02999 family)